MRTGFIALALLTTIALPLRSVAASEIPEYQLKAEFLERFTRFIDWPAQAHVNRDPSQPFVIGIVGRDPFNGYLQTMLDEHRQLKGHRGALLYVSDLEQVDECDLLFVSSSEKARLPEILARTAGRPILTVGDTPGFGESGVVINLYAEGDRIRFEINERAVDRSGLKVQAKLYKLARVIAEAHR